MELKFVKQRLNAEVTHLNNASYLNNRIGFWANVIAVNDKENRVDVLSDTGIEYRNIPVVSNVWVVKTDKYVSGERYLPPLQSRVFVLTPTNSIPGAFVLCSGYAAGESEKHNLYANETNEGELATIHEQITEGGWNIKEDYQNGNKCITSNDEKIKIELNTVDNDQQSQKKEVKIVAWKHTIKIDEKNGITIESSDNTNGIVINTTQKTTVKASADVTIDAGSNNVNITAGQLNVNNGDLIVT